MHLKRVVTASQRASFPIPLPSIDRDATTLYQGLTSAVISKEMLTMNVVLPHIMDTSHPQHLNAYFAKTLCSRCREPWRGLGYVHTPGTEDAVKPVTHWVCADLQEQVRLAFLGV